MNRSRREGSPAPQLPVHGLSEARTSVLDDEHWDSLARRGFLDLGPICRSEEAQSLRNRGEQLDVTELGDRIADLELRPFLELMHHPLFHEVSTHVYGRQAPVMVFRSEFKRPHAGAPGPWRQNAGQLADLDRDEVVNIVVGLGDVSIEVIPASHRLGLVNPAGGTLSAPDAARCCPENRVLRVDVASGHAVLLHKWLMHRPVRSRGAQSGCMIEYWFVDGRARSITTGYHHLPMLIGAVERVPYPCVQILEDHCAALREALAHAQGEVARLNREVDVLRSELGPRRS